MEIATQNRPTELAIKEPPKITLAQEKAMQEVRNNSGMEIALPKADYVNWLAEKTKDERMRLRYIKRDEKHAYIHPIVSDLRKITASYYDYDLHEKHTFTSILAMVDLIFSNYPMLAYNKTPAGVATIETREGQRQIAIYEAGEVYAAFRQAALNNLDYTFVKHANSTLNVQVLEDVLKAYEKFRRVAKAAIDYEKDRIESERKKAIELKQKREKAQSWWVEKWKQVKEKCEWTHYTDVQHGFYSCWIESYNLHEFSEDEDNVAMEIAKTLRLRVAKVTASDTQAKPSDVGSANRIISLMGEPNSDTEKAETKVIAQQVILYMHFTRRNPLDEPLTKPKK